MPLTDDQLELIRDSFKAIRQDLQPASTHFYDELFRRAPSFRSLFRDDLAGQGMKFMSTLAVLVDNLHNPDALAERYADLGAMHRSVGVTAAHFGPLGEALIATLRHESGERFTPETERAWRAAYEDFSRHMIEAGHIPAK